MAKTKWIKLSEDLTDGELAKLEYTVDSRIIGKEEADKLSIEEVKEISLSEGKYAELYAKFEKEFGEELDAQIDAVIDEVLAEMQ